MSKIKRRFCCEAVHVEMWVVSRDSRGRLPKQSPPFYFAAEILSLFLLRCCAGSGGLL